MLALTTHVTEYVARSSGECVGQQVRMSTCEYRGQCHCRRVLYYQSVLTEHRRLDIHLRRHGRSVATAEC